MTAPALQAAHGSAGAIAFHDSELGGPVAHLSSAHGTALVALQGAQVLSYVPRGGTEVLWLSPMARLGTAKAVRGGIPVCWPWFGPHPTDPRQPAHGLVRSSCWRVVETAVHGHAVRVRFVSTLETATAGFPAGLSAQLDVTLGEELALDLVTINDGDEAIELTQALHTYLKVGDIGSVTVAGLHGRPYVDQLEPPGQRRGARKLQTGLVVFEGEVDRIYATGDPIATVLDPLLGRRIVVDTDGSASTVVWNPWIEKAARLGDVGPDGYRAFVCIETANAGADVRTIQPGAAHRLTAMIHAATAAASGAGGLNPEAS